MMMTGRRWPVRRIELASGLILLIVVAFGCWLGYEAVHAKSNLEEARTSAQQAREALLKGDSEDAARSSNEARTQAQAARDSTHSLPWKVASSVPWLGGPFKTGQQLSEVVLGLTTEYCSPRLRWPPRSHRTGCSKATV